MFEKSMTNSQYADLWEKESIIYKEKGLYRDLYNLLPSGKVLEFGCGAGFSTEELLKNHEVLSLECNPFLISKASNYLGVKKTCIYKCDFLQLSKKDKDVIQEFKPDIIVGCFLGANGLDVLNHVKEKISLNEKPKKYREKIEDVIVSKETCLHSVSVIQLVNRGTNLPELYTDEEVSASVIDDYNTYVFGNTDFRIEDISFFEWDYEMTGLNYSAISDINIQNKITKPRITSILAKK